MYGGDYSVRKMGTKRKGEERVKSAPQKRIRVHTTSKLKISAKYRHTQQPETTIFLRVKLSALTKNIRANGSDGRESCQSCLPRQQQQQQQLDCTFLKLATTRSEPRRGRMSLSKAAARCVASSPPLGLPSARTSHPARHFLLPLRSGTLEVSIDSALQLPPPPLPPFTVENAEAARSCAALRTASFSGGCSPAFVKLPSFS